MFGIHRSRLGFTLIELLVAVAIGAILVAGGLAAYRGIGEKQTLKQAGLELETNLRSVQKKALSGEKPTGCSGVLQGFRVKYKSSTSYAVQADCSLTNSPEQEFNLPEGVEFSAAFSEDIFFPVLKSGLIGAQTLTLQSDSFSYQVIVGSSGVIQGEML
jgi:prepilin-type N-terminal cleavage/methylation domain-containing protein